MNALSAVYGRLVSLRRDWYARHPARRRRLPCPVISVGNLAAGGSGKTPVVAALAEMLLAAGERPAILSRGYGRVTRAGDVVVVSDGREVLMPVERSGDEPQMLARRLPGVPVLVASERYLAGRLALDRFRCTVLVLDDGFQHLRLARDLDLVIVSQEDLGERLLPSGMLREPLAAARAADAVLVHGVQSDARRIAGVLGVARAFAVTASYEAPTLLSSGAVVDDALRGSVAAVAGIARPWRFFTALREAGWQVTAELPFHDHHWFTDDDLARVAASARAARAPLVITTEKDAVRLGAAPTAVPWAVLRMRVGISPDGEFREWMMERVAAARRGAAAGPSASGGAPP